MMNLDGIPDYMDYMKEYPQFFKDLLGFPFFGRDWVQENSQDAPPGMILAP